jgi:hypothetical protein
MLVLGEGCAEAGGGGRVLGECDRLLGWLGMLGGFVCSICPSLALAVKRGEEGRGVLFSFDMIV